MNLSTNCTQKIENRCFTSALTKFASWTDRFGTKNHFWHGDHNSTDEGCRCSFESECASFGLMKTLCNCDGFGNDAVDSGEITSMDKLPVSALSYGTSIPNGKINFYLGPMICSGKRGIFPSEQNDADKQNVQKQLQNVTEDLKNVEKGFQLKTVDLQSQLKELQSNFDQTLDQLANVTAFSQTISRQKRECEKNLGEFAQAFNDQFQKGNM